MLHLFAQPPRADQSASTLMGRRRFAAVVALGCCLQAPVRSSPSAQPPGRADFPNVVLLNQDSQPVRFYEDLVRGDHVVAINFIYAQCSDICPATTANLAQVQALLGDRLGRDVRMASISIDPRRDTPTILKAYAGNFHARAGWQFLTGRLQDIERIRRQLGVFDRDPAKDRDKSQHTGMLVYGNEARGRWSRIPALADPQRIVASITRWS
jgi:protein SCO1